MGKKSKAFLDGLLTFCFTLFALIACGFIMVLSWLLTTYWGTLTGGK